MYVINPSPTFNNPNMISLISVRQAKTIIAMEASMKIIWKSGNRGARKVCTVFLFLYRKTNTPITTNREETVNKMPQ